MIVNTEVYSGDFVALVENGTDQVICGRIEKMLGLITIESQDMKPESFEENNVEILGKIVGFADPAERKDGKLKVTALEQFS